MSDRFHHLAAYVSAFPSVRVLCLGDIMLDRYVYGSVSRVSAEAPVPIVSHQSELVTLGAVGNVARNVVALGGQATVVAIESAGGSGTALRPAFPRCGGKSPSTATKRHLSWRR